MQPTRLIGTQFIQQRTELASILGTIDVLGMDANALLQQFIERSTAHGKALLGDEPFGFRCTVAQRVPEPFVWKARMQAALDKALDPQLRYPPPEEPP